LAGESLTGEPALAAPAFRSSRCLAAALVLTGAWALQGCADGRRGLPPPPADVAYPNVNAVPSGHQNRLKTEAEQQRLKAELLAKTRPGARR
jgi:hypothetical protein